MTWIDAGFPPSHSNPVLIAFEDEQYLVATWEAGAWWSGETDEQIDAKVLAWAEIPRR